MTKDKPPALEPDESIMTTFEMGNKFPDRSNVRVIRKAKHHVGDDCLAEHYEGTYLACGQDFMAGTICSLPAGHDGPDAAWCPICDGDWASGTCTCPKG